MGVVDPGVTRHRLDLVEALVGIGELDEAEEVQERFESAARELHRGWALTLARRTRALIMSARGDPNGALELIDIALHEIDAFENPIERARMLLSRGTIARRAKLRTQARTALEAAQAEFERLGLPLWAERARAEASRLGGKTRQSTELTATERRVAEAVASGLSNKQAAALLFVSVRAIEANLTRIYAKLGVNSRTQLAARLKGQEEMV
jgi:DNA-binding NarL/FixJ family response regulator